MDRMEWPSGRLLFPQKEACMTGKGLGTMAADVQAGERFTSASDGSPSENPAALRSRLTQELPYLRRYARALTGSQSAGDAFVREMLEAALASPELLARIGRGRVPLYEAFSAIWITANVEPQGHPRAGDTGGEGDTQIYSDAGEQKLQDHLTDVSPIQRQALLLTQLEDFSLAETGEILGLAPAEIAFLVEQALAEVDRDVPTDVLIIEDEPLISTHIAAIVEEAGHRVVAVAASAAQASDAYAALRPGLVLADIHLADGSSGLIAVDDMLAIGPVPVIFITAFPEKLLTGIRPEPSFLVTKPFREETVRTAISQALYFGANRASATLASA
jgi:DNA-directed RNA polymerase specialized sigma24 family protein/CheY-like chemotaxis protein